MTEREWKIRIDRLRASDGRFAGLSDDHLAFVADLPRPTPPPLTRAEIRPVWRWLLLRKRKESR